MNAIELMLDQTKAGITTIALTKKGIFMQRIKLAILIGKIQYPRTLTDQNTDILAFKSLAFKVTTKAFN